MSFFWGMLGGVVAHLVLGLLSRFRASKPLEKLRLRIATRLAGPQCTIVRNEIPCIGTEKKTDEPLNLS